MCPACLDIYLMLNRAKFINYIQKNGIIFVFPNLLDPSITNNKNPLRNPDAIQTESSDSSF